MTKKPTKRTKSLQAGFVSRIASVFIKPLLIYKPEAQGMKEWLEQLFDTKNRHIYQFRARREFKMLGEYITPPHAAPRHPVQGLGYRKVRYNQRLWVRFDDLDPAHIQVEFDGGPGKKDQVYQLTPSEWNWVEEHVKKLKNQSEH